MKVLLFILFLTLTAANKMSDDWSIYPNPAHSYFNIIGAVVVFFKIRNVVKDSK